MCGRGIRLLSDCSMNRVSWHDERSHTPGAKEAAEKHKVFALRISVGLQPHEQGQ
jgi:hypothetical protein